MNAPVITSSYRPKMVFREGCCYVNVGQGMWCIRQLCHMFDEYRTPRCIVSLQEEILMRHCPFWQRDFESREKIFHFHSLWCRKRKLPGQAISSSKDHVARFIY